MEPKTVSDAQLRELIADIDGFHGNELKERSEASIQQEIETIRRWLKQIGG